MRQGLAAQSYFILFLGISSTDATSSTDILRGDLPKSRFFLGGELPGSSQGAVAADNLSSPGPLNSVGLAADVGDGSISHRSEGSSSVWANLFDSGWPPGAAGGVGVGAEDCEGSGGGADAWLPGRCPSKPGRSAVF